MELVAICHRCAPGKSTCPQDGKPMHEHATAKSCPLDYYATRSTTQCRTCGGAHRTSKCPKRRTKFIDSLPEDERAIVLEIDKAPEGVGDTLAALLAKLGADKAAKLFEKISGRKCGCAKRRKWLNRWWPYR